jgi:hypothetical protein
MPTRWSARSRTLAIPIMTMSRRRRFTTTIAPPASLWDSFRCPWRQSVWIFAQASSLRFGRSLRILGLTSRLIALALVARPLRAQNVTAAAKLARFAISR